MYITVKKFSYQKNYFAGSSNIIIISHLDKYGMSNILKVYSNHTQ
jgi:hypothetical protein